MKTDDLLDNQDLEHFGSLWVYWCLPAASGFGPRHRSYQQTVNAGAVARFCPKHALCRFAYHFLSLVSGGIDATLELCPAGMSAGGCHLVLSCSGTEPDAERSPGRDRANLSPDRRLRPEGNGHDGGP